MATQVLKADGTQEAYDESKLRRSLKKAGASSGEIKEISRRVNDILYDGIKTQTIYRKAFEYLRSSSHPEAARYSLRRALYNLGPTGFPFEDFIARLLEAEGYNAQTRLELQGNCVVHEIDVIAYGDEGCSLVEAKFHGRHGIKSDLQDVLYSYARFLDLQHRKVHKSQVCGISDTLIVTNTKFTTAAVQYATCVGMKLLSWEQPAGNTLQDRIERAGIYPVTALSSLSLKNKQDLLKGGHILCAEILDNRDILRSIGCTEKRIEATLAESRHLCKKGA